jgi:hypothetical protein
MKDFERTDLRAVQQQIDDGCGFRVGDHNYGRVDRMSEDELWKMFGHVTALANQASALLDAMEIEADRRGLYSGQENV